MGDLAIRAVNLSKRYEIGAAQQPYKTLRDTFTAALTGLLRRSSARDSSTIWALRDVDFEIKRGEVVGLVGRNGAGKSTLLKILSRITEPTTGSVEIHGRVGSLLEVGTGFHSELSGRENIYLSGAILGMKRSEIQGKLDEIVAFAEVDRFLDTPVKRYSSGMYLRLAFAVAAHLEPEILVVDEVLAVGDVAFQRKCLGRMTHVAQEGRTVVFVSHNMSAILRLCSEAILLDGGRIILRASCPEVVEQYLSSGAQNGGGRVWRAEELPDTSGPFRPMALRVCDAAGAVTDVVRSSQPFSIEIEYQLDAPVPGLGVQIKLYTRLGELLFISSDADDPAVHGSDQIRMPGHYVSRCHIPADLLNGGGFVVGISVAVPSVRRYFWEQDSARFTVDVSGGVGTHWAGERGGFFRPSLRWDIECR